MDKELKWEIFEIESRQYKRLPPWGIGFKKEDSIVPEIVAYCFTHAQAIFTLDAIKRDATVDDYEWWIKEKEGK